MAPAPVVGVATGGADVGVVGVLPAAISVVAVVGARRGVEVAAVLFGVVVGGVVVVGDGVARAAGPSEGGLTGFASGSSAPTPGRLTGGTHGARAKLAPSITK